ncbi:PEP-CTERM sorting domain-containing protein [Nostoc sp. NMS4]|uniref:PEP-CTERM sorting domain-containing protein n=1 Tax=Nostoc sp. NMS4 TaxID=2815390 RepID=UPI0025F81821|nr:PEP-CTERM sorting domain-containing protein [Nostoc sp. NMS4]MBN3924115.1 PEP-CTERM sorting domain-containing protein [Nostoc sp. NMS4]
MINFKSKLVNATLAATFAIPLATAGLFTSAGSAQAAGFSGSFNYDPYAPRGTTQPTVQVGSNSLAFKPQSPVELDLAEQTGTFIGFDIAGIYNATLPYDNIFFDLGKFNDANNTSNDGKNVFVLESLDAPILSSNNGVTGVVNFKGYFTDTIGSLTKTAGKGHLNFSLNPLVKLADANTALSNGKKITGTFTGAAFTSVPEPAALLGLGAVGAVMAISRRRKSFAQ